MDALLNKIRNSVIGDNQIIQTSFGAKPLVYADYTASGRALSFIEDIIRDKVLPYYANTHTETSYTGAVTTRLREDARDEIRRAVNGSDEHKVIFCGSGATAANQKIIDILNLRIPSDLNEKYKLEDLIPAAEKPVVFIGPYEHHSNEIGWRECYVDLVVIPLNVKGHLDLEALKQRLEEYKDRAQKIGSFSAASNVTGLKTDVDTVSALLHRYNALSFWDYAAAAPYVEIDMLGSQINGEDTSKDAVFLSPHKFVGGPGTPGVLIANEKLLINRVPAVPGGGTVVYVTPESHRYVEDPVRKEEGGTPAIVESIRAGLVFKLQQQVGTKKIEALETAFVEQAIDQWSKNSNIHLLGSTTASRLSIISFSIKHNEKDLHYGYIVALLNDLFGIQARGGCSCAGPYGHHLLEMGIEYSQDIESQLLKGQMILRPGWVRVNFNYFIDQATFDYIVSAVELIAEHAWRLLPFYKFDEARGIWNFQGHETSVLSCFDSIDFEVEGGLHGQTESTACSDQLNGYLLTAKSELLKDRSQTERYEIVLPPEAEKLRWFARPQDMTGV